MIATMEIVEALDQADHISKLVKDSEIMKKYKEAKQDLANDIDAQKLISSFTKIKEQYEDVQRFGRYHPDYNEIMKKVRSVKREVDMNEKVATFKKAERELQNLLDDISTIIAQSVSQNIMVPKDGLLFQESGGGCGCGSGGSCGCAS